ncbi:hypothetical protein [Polaribacter cellanae]|uniref:Uncharacterized protein n=1 Tax=Polaribacter cellanae TaxID=2818493 RepID=A0A975H882_9FLAO|nr:hypothetical protein [Polaribacter cellanae]QTE23833.1 hypothetical protein J3359_06080 [Polaribacter cellanae]
MSNNYKDSKFRELLDKLQQESWQLELLISGFAIFGLFTAIPLLITEMSIAENNKEIYSYSILIVSFIACSILIFNLLVHVVLRGLWIGALGLRYVSGDIDFDTLNYHNRFTKYLQKRIVSFDRYVGNLENYCSVLFAISFLLIFYVITIFIIVLCFVGIATLILSNDSLPETLRTIVGVTLMILLGIGTFLMFVDFVTQGYLKKKKWLSKIYFPFYKVFSFLTLTFLYRPLVYNFLDNKFTKKISFFLVPSYIFILILISFKYKNTNYLENVEYVSSVYVNPVNYEDLLLKKGEFVKRASIQSKVITGSYIKVFKVYSERVENQIFKFYPALKPEEDRRGLHTTIIQYDLRSSKKTDSLTKKYLEIFNKMHQVYIDTLNVDEDFVVTKNRNKQLGFETFISTKNLSEGKHNLIIKRLKEDTENAVKTIDIVIPFWYFKE